MDNLFNKILYNARKYIKYKEQKLIQKGGVLPESFKSKIDNIKKFIDTNKEDKDIIKKIDATKKVFNDILKFREDNKDKVLFKIPSKINELNAYIVRKLEEDSIKFNEELTKLNLAAQYTQFKNYLAKPTKIEDIKLLINDYVAKYYYILSSFLSDKELDLKTLEIQDINQIDTFLKDKKINLETSLQANINKLKELKTLIIRKINFYLQELQNITKDAIEIFEEKNINITNLQDIKQIKELENLTIKNKEDINLHIDIVDFTGFSKAMQDIITNSTIQDSSRIDIQEVKQEGGADQKDLEQIYNETELKNKVSEIIGLITMINNKYLFRFLELKKVYERKYNRYIELKNYQIDILHSIIESRKDKTKQISLANFNFLSLGIIKKYKVIMTKIMSYIDIEQSLNPSEDERIKIFDEKYFFVLINFINLFDKLIQKINNDTNKVIVISECKENVKQYLSMFNYFKDILEEYNKDEFSLSYGFVGDEFKCDNLQDLDMAGMILEDKENIDSLLTKLMVNLDIKLNKEIFLINTGYNYQDRIKTLIKSIVKSIPEDTISFKINLFTIDGKCMFHTSKVEDMYEQLYKLEFEKEDFLKLSKRTQDGELLIINDIREISNNYKQIYNKYHVIINIFNEFERELLLLQKLNIANNIFIYDLVFLNGDKERKIKILDMPSITDTRHFEEKVKSKINYMLYNNPMFLFLCSDGLEGEIAKCLLDNAELLRDEIQEEKEYYGGGKPGPSAKPAAKYDRYAPAAAAKPGQAAVKQPAAAKPGQPAAAKPGQEEKKEDLPIRNEQQELLEARQMLELAVRPKKEIQVIDVNQEEILRNRTFKYNKFLDDLLKQNTYDNKTEITFYKDIKTNPEPKINSTTAKISDLIDKTQLITNDAQDKVSNHLTEMQFKRNIFNIDIKITAKNPKDEIFTELKKDNYTVVIIHQDEDYNIPNPDVDKDKFINKAKQVKSEYGIKLNKNVQHFNHETYLYYNLRGQKIVATNIIKLFLKHHEYRILEKFNNNFNSIHKLYYSNDFLQSIKYYFCSKNQKCDFRFNIKENKSLKEYLLDFKRINNQKENINQEIIEQLKQNNKFYNFQQIIEPNNNNKLIYQILDFFLLSKPSIKLITTLPTENYNSCAYIRDSIIYCNNLQEILEL